MIIVLLIFLFLVKFDYPSVYCDYLIVLLLLLMIVSVIYTIYISRKISINCKADNNRFLENDDLILNFDLTGTGLIGRIDLLIERKLLQKNDIKKELIKDISGKDNKTIEIKDLKAGIYQIKIDKIIVLGFFKIFRYFKKTDQVFEFVVYPKPVEEDHSKLRSIVLGEDGELTNQKGNDYSEIFEIREFEDGDNLKHIHRPLTAKFDRYMIKVGTKSERKMMVYQMEKKEDFSDVVKNLGKAVYFYNEFVVKENAFFCINYDQDWILIIEESDLESFIKGVYSEYII